MTNRSAAGQDGCSWEVGFLRATTFIPDLTREVSVENTWWDKIVADKPEDERINHQKGMKKQRGKFKSNNLTMVSQLGRVDLTLGAADEEPPEPPKLPSIGPMSTDTLDPFMQIIKSWLNACPPANRLAFGAILGKPTVGTQTGHEEILSYLPDLQLDPQNISDLFYHINRPKISTVDPSIRINRMSTWSVPLVGTVGVAIDPAVSSATTDIQEWHICKLELDISTPLLSDVIVGDVAYAIFRELADHGQSIAGNGDIP